MASWKDNNVLREYSSSFHGETFQVKGKLEIKVKGLKVTWEDIEKFYNENLDGLNYFEMKLEDIPEEESLMRKLRAIQCVCLVNDFNGFEYDEGNVYFEDDDGFQPAEDGVTAEYPGSGEIYGVEGYYDSGSWWDPPEGDDNSDEIIGDIEDKLMEEIQKDLEKLGFNAEVIASFSVDM